MQKVIISYISDDPLIRFILTLINGAMKFIFFLMWVFFCLSSCGDNKQEETIVKGSEMSIPDSVYHEYRIKETTPPYGLDKVQGLIQKIQYNEEDESEALSDSIYSLLTFREKFTYHMIHPESFSQICDAIPMPENEYQRIFGFLPETYNDYAWSQRQTAFLNANRDSVMALIKESVLRSKRMGINYKQAVAEINGKEMIPFLIETYKASKKDRDILTLLMLLMRWNKYKPFVSSASYKKLYSDEYNYGSYIEYNTANEELIIKRATDFYNESNK